MIVIAAIKDTYVYDQDTCNEIDNCLDKLWRKLPIIDNLEIIQSYKRYAMPSIFQENLMYKNRKLYFATAILLDSRYNELKNTRFFSLSNNLKNTIRKIANGGGKVINRTNAAPFFVLILVRAIEKNYGGNSKFQ